MTDRLTVEREAQILELVASIPAREYKVFDEHFPWKAIGVRDAQDAEQYNIVADVNCAQFQRGDGLVDDHRRLPEFFAAAPQAVRDLLAEVDALRAERNYLSQHSEHLETVLGVLATPFDNEALSKIAVLSDGWSWIAGLAAENLQKAVAAGAIRAYRMEDGAINYEDADHDPAE